MRFNRRSTEVVMASATAVAMVWLATTWATADDPNDPRTAPQPQYDYDNTGKSFLVELNFGAASATLVNAKVGEQLSYSHLGDPPLLRLSLTDEDGAPAGSLNSWDPRGLVEEAPGGGERHTQCSLGC